MPPITNETKSFRQFAEDSAKLAIKSALNCSDGTLEDVLSILAKVPALREEGEKIWPNLIITDRIETVCSQIPNSSILKIGRIASGSGSIAKAFKSLSPLCELPWCGWINLSGEIITFGLLTCEDNQLGLSVLDNLSSSREDWPDNTLYAFPASETVLVIQSKARILHLSFSLTEYTHSNQNPISLLSQSIINSSDDTNVIRKAGSYLSKVLIQAISNSHGCIIGVVKTDSALEWAARHPEACWLTDQIDVIDEVRIFVEASKTNSENCILLDNRLRLVARAISSMIRQDGIALFSDAGKLLCYRLFVKSIDSDGSGGARSKAFSKLCSEQNLVRAYFKSQDGQIKLFPEA